MFIWSFISSSLDFWSVNYTSIHENTESKVAENIKFWLKYQIVDQMNLYEQIYTKLLNIVDNHC